MSAPTLDLSPAPGAAAAPSRVLRQARTEFLLLVRNGEQLLLALVVPLGVLLLARVAPADLTARFGGLQGLAPSVLALAVWSSAFTSTAIATGFERRYGVLERLASTPLGRSGLVLGKAVALLWVVLAQLLVLGVAALALGWRPAGEPLPWLAGVAAVALAVVCFAAWGLALAGALRAEVTLAVANLVYLLLAATGALVLGPENYPGVWGAVVPALPTAALGESLRNASAGVVDASHLVVLLVWTLLGLLIARRSFRWTA
ncbi:ABC transporter permease [Desertihabitans brevis]|uniref:ABC transporter permease n=1 Tax=Desertihabitans brevis TaxID=2268447 RepID=A0A367YXJ3_9ACTN|nr:ABC transporter permease [Desertihabitans brevis]RCK70548.1 ABC transporter permease [Desertihabitans brevis]